MKTHDVIEKSRREKIESEIKDTLTKRNGMKNTEYFKTGSTLLDLITGGAAGVFGYPAGRFINIVGDKSAGKSFLATELIAAAYHYYPKNKFQWKYDDCEAGYSFDTMSMYGFEITSGDINNSVTIEEAFVNIHNFAAKLKPDQFGIYVLDSLDGLTSDEQNEQADLRVKTINAGKEFDKGTYGMGKPKYLSREFFPQLCSRIQDKNILVVIISQVRENISMFSFEKYKRSGGKAMDHFAHTVLWLATVKKITKKEKPIGTVIKAKTTKSKTPRPFREACFSVLFDYGIDNIGSNIDFLYDLRTEKGELTASAKAVTWGTVCKKPDAKNIKKFLAGLPYKKDISYYDRYKTEYKKFMLESALEFAEKELADEYAKEFAEGGVIMSRDALIKYIEENCLEKELEKLCIEKWERLETEIASDRKKRYGTQPRGSD